MLNAASGRAEGRSLVNVTCLAIAIHIISIFPGFSPRDRNPLLPGRTVFIAGLRAFVAFKIARGALSSRKAPLAQQTASATYAALATTTLGGK